MADCLILNKLFTLNVSCEWSQNFKNLSGLEINTTKTEGMWLGRWKNKSDMPFGFRWPRDPIKALGIFFSYDKNKTNELNFAEKIRNLEKTLNNWKKRNLTLYGEINIVKTFGLSKLIYNASVLVIPEHFIKETEKLIFDFIWDGKPAKIKKVYHHRREKARRTQDDRF